jgi:hypothetical protein
MTVAQLMHSMSSREFSEWYVMERIEPWGERRHDLLFAHLMSLLANINRPNKEAKVFKPLDFLLDWDGVGQPQKTMTPEETVSFIANINQALGGKDLRRNVDDS